MEEGIFVFDDDIRLDFTCDDRIPVDSISCRDVRFPIREDLAVKLTFPPRQVGTRSVFVDHCNECSVPWTSSTIRS